jgi:hypothetical protein
MMRYLRFSIYLLAFAVVSACEKPDKIPAVPEIIIKSPSANQTYNSGDTVRIKSDVTHTSDLHEVAVTVKNANDSALFEFEKHVDAPELKIDTFFVNHVTADNQAEVSIIATDHNSNSSTKNIHIILRK